MKKYFAKYVPIEGKVKEGYHLDKNKNEIIYYNGDYGDVKPSFLIPVKLCICTREIKIGDMAKDTKQPLTDFYVDEKDIIRIKSGTDELYSQMDLYKVVGKISSEASWVKEGDMFDREDLMANGVGVNWNDTYDNYTFKIKGKCGRFH